MEKQEPVAWLDRSTEERPGDTVWLPDDLQGMSTRGFIPLYADPPVAAPVLLTSFDIWDLFQAWNMNPRASHADLIISVKTAVLRANGFKAEGEQ